MERYGRLRAHHRLPHDAGDLEVPWRRPGAPRIAVARATKLYAVRNASGQFKDIQTYKRAHRADLAKTSKAEKTARKKATGRRKTAKKR